jgi:hypothetical protein
MKPAGRWKRGRQESLVETQCRYYCLPHCFTNRSTSRRSSSGVAVKAKRRGLITISHCDPISCRRTRSTSRILLFTRFRFTAFPKTRGTVKPSLGPTSSRRTRRQNAAKYGLVNRVPSLYALRKSVAFRIRALFGKPRLIGIPNGSLVANREFVAAFGSPPRQHSASIFGAHAHQEPVSLCPFAVVRLKCTFWHLISSARASDPKR